MQFGPRTMLFFMLLLAMPVAAWWYMFKPFDAHKHEVQRQTMENLQKLSDMKQLTAQNPNAAADIENLKKVIAMLESKLPAEKEMAKVLNEVTDLEGKSGLTTKSVRTLSVIEGSNYNELPIRFVIQGPMKDGFYKFLAGIEHLQRLTKVKDMKIDADDKIPGLVTVDMVLTIYFEAGEKVAVAQ
jgi:type IV pilus assembly protein PilO